MLLFVLNAELTQYLTFGLCCLVLNVIDADISVDEFFFFKEMREMFSLYS